RSAWPGHTWPCRLVRRYQPTPTPVHPATTQVARYNPPESPTVSADEPFFYDCTGCGTLLRPKPGDCCVFCSFGSVPCPPIQKAGGKDACCAHG
ncbi:MAG TPA: GDCCVxC domain-containing (seleno)protein, partial [Bryobacteraceae bacterium]|nr:GDCCVxC domain-containing (seleno)protein [Bryobacteraceae bacterium]